MIQLESNRQVIQHQDGGVVSAILARDGDVVAPGDVLIRLDGTQLQSELSIVNGQLQETAGRRARLIAERDGKDEIIFSEELLKAALTDPDAQAKIDGERQLFITRRVAVAGDRPAARAEPADRQPD